MGPPRNTDTVVAPAVINGFPFALLPRLQQCEEDIVIKDSQIRGLKEELVHQDDLVAKLQKEKRQLADSRQKTEEDLQVNQSLDC